MRVLAISRGADSDVKGALVMPTPDEYALAIHAEV